MRILGISAVFPPAWHYGGPPLTAHSLLKALKRQGHTVFAITTGDSERDGSPVLDHETEYDTVPVIYCSRGPQIIPFYSPRLKHEVAKRISAFDIAIIRSSWTYVGPAASAECRRRHVPYLAYPEGTFDTWPLRQKRLKKFVFWHFFDHGYFSNASAIVALTKSEAESIRQMGLRNRLEIIPNGIEVSDYAEGESRDALERRFPKLIGRLWVLFIGRIHPKKGLAQLVLAFAQVIQHYHEALLVIAGPDEREHRREIEVLVQQHGLSNHVLFTGPVLGKEKVGFLQNADIFVLPSHSEGFPMAVLEALACGVPVVLTKGCHVPEVAEAGAGIEVDIDPCQIAIAISSLLSDDTARRQMGRNGRKLVCERFTWERVARETAALCEELCH